ncbi:MAG: F0F1 ATP synthase subunit B' [Alphaproteobacteria bacterium]|jgi:F-type H+-transporting ATPase subunit b|nr:F0F1 ATP synthase subunit B' [Alphaproteobacteria bacterium]
MPQFDPTWFVSQIFWLVLVFGALYWLMVKRALPKVSKALDARAERIQGDLDRAAKLQRDAEITAETYEAAIAKARDEAREAIRAAQVATVADLDARQDVLSKELAAQASAAEARIAEASKDAMASVREIAVGTAQAAAGHLIGGNVDEAKAASAVDGILNRQTTH